MKDPVLSWNDDLGLCRQEAAGHTVPVAKLPLVHNGVITANHLCVLAQHGLLDETRTLAALRAFRAMQEGPASERPGCLRWYWEEPAPVDTNASFFIGLALQMLYLAERERLSPPVLAAIREIVGGLAVWFGRELVEANPRYPNKCLGDLACSWLATEILEQPPSAQLLQTTRDWCDYWRREKWGWGEHMSDIYAKVLLLELSAVLLYCHNLPRDIYGLFKAHFDDLLAIEDAYGEGPRVPVIRSYAFTESPPVQPFRACISPAPARDTDRDGGPPPIIIQAPAAVLGPWLLRAGWAELAGPQRAAQAWLETPCRAGTVARAMVRQNLRVGAMSAYPVMAGVDHQNWGLSWQTFPAALWRTAGDWAFWRWTTREGERVRAHPALDLRSAYLGNALAARVDPPPVPRMSATLTRDGHLCMERMLPLPAEAKWDEVSDEFHLLNSDAKVALQEGALVVHWPDATVRVRWLGEETIAWESADRGGRWVVRYTPAQLTGRDALVHRWELFVG